MRIIFQALTWAGENADIINLSWSLGSMEPEGTGLNRLIKELVNSRKLIFAAASNAGLNEDRPWPANRPGVFCIHATDEDGIIDDRMNLEATDKYDNFATLGCGIRSYWDGKPVSIRGTSFAAPVAAAMAANILEFMRRTRPGIGQDYMNFKRMSELFRDMTGNQTKGSYHKLRPWKTGLFDGAQQIEDVAEKLMKHWNGTLKRDNEGTAIWD
jgi:hypothetical protein